MYSNTLIAVCTYKRPLMLYDCLTSLAPQQADVLVVDNDPEPHRIMPAPCNIVVVIEPVRGIPSARNAALKYALDAGYEFLAFTDDDCIVQPDWLAKLHDMQASTNADAVTGPQYRRYMAHVPAYARRAEKGPRGRADGEKRRFAATNNLLLKLEFVKCANLWFDESLGDDKVFTLALTQAGGKIVWTNQAIVTETVPPERTTLSWTARRSFHLGTHYAQIAIIQGDDTSYLRAKARRNIINGLLRFTAAPFAFLALRGKQTLYSAARTMFKGLGIRAGLKGQRSTHYRTTTGY